ncbi:MAG: flagellin [Lachnospiraceae bacterium]|nr:flagellin [Lachnospiraceae bacterium]
MGYVGVMYLGHIAGGGNPDGSNIDPAKTKEGLDKILTELAGGKTLSEAIDKYTGYHDQADFENTFTNNPGQILSFFKNHLNAVGSNGAGSLLGTTLAQTEGDLFNTSDISLSSAANYNLDTDHKMVSNAYAGDITIIPAPDSYDDGMGKLIYLQVGAANREEQRIAVKRFNISCDSLFEGDKMDFSTVEEARASLERIDKADLNVSGIRSYYGAIQNRLEHTILNLDNIVENTTAAESQIRDTDMAKEMVNYTKTNVLIQAGNAMLSQAMQNPQNILQLLS